MEEDRRKSRASRKGQNLIEYLILFVILAGLSWILAQKVPSIFNSYVATATDKMK